MRPRMIAFAAFSNLCVCILLMTAFSYFCQHSEGLKSVPDFGLRYAAETRDNSKGAVTATEAGRKGAKFSPAPYNTTEKMNNRVKTRGDNRNRNKDKVLVDENFNFAKSKHSLLLKIW
jgi:hypothetical protein